MKKIHRIIEFRQQRWLEPYIDFNNRNRMYATTDFYKDFFKLMNNSFFGKTCENIRNRKDVHLVSQNDEALKLHNKPNFVDETIFDETLTAIQMGRTSITFNKPIYIGSAILELSKLFMYEFYYGALQHYFGENSLELVYHDTDSFV